MISVIIAIRRPQPPNAHVMPTTYAGHVSMRTINGKVCRNPRIVRSPNGGTCDPVSQSVLIPRSIGDIS